MNRTLIAAVSAFLLAASCSREVKPAPAPAKAAVRFAAAETATEGDVFIFRGKDGALDCRGSVEGNLTPLAWTLSHWYILKNIPPIFMENILREKDLLSREIHLEDVSSPMTASGRCIFQEGGSTVNASLERLSCQISIEEIQIKEEGHHSIGRVIILGAGTSCTLGEKIICTGEIIGSWEDDFELFPVEGCRLSLEIILDGVSNWYTAELPALKKNTRYVFNRIIINGPGASEPGGAIERIESSFNLTVNPWEEYGNNPMF